MMFCTEQETVATTALEDSSIRVQSAASCYDSENDEEKPSFSEYGTGPGEVVENSDIESINQRLSSAGETSYPELSLVTNSIDGSGYETETKDRISNDAFKKLFTKQDSKTTTQNSKSAKEDIKPVKQDYRATTQDIKSANEDIKPVKQELKTTTQDIKPVKQDTRTTIQNTKPGKLNIKPAQQDTKPARQDIPLASDVLEPQITEVSPTDAQEHKTLKNAVLHEQKIERTTSEITQNTEIGDGQSENRKDIQSTALSPEGNHNNEDNVTIAQNVEQESDPVKKTEFEENHGFASDDDSVTSFPDNDITIKTKASKILNLAEKHQQKNEEVFEMTESTQVDVVESIQTPATDSGKTDPIESLHSNIAEVKQSPQTTVNTNDSNVFLRDIHLLSGKNLKTDKLSDKVGPQFSDKGQSFCSDTNYEKDKTNAEAGMIQQTSNSYDNAAQSGNRFTSESHDSSKPIKKQEYKDNGSADTKKVDSQSYVPKEAKISERKKNNQEREKSKLDESSKMKEEAKSAKVKTEKAKQEKLDIQGVGKADNVVTDTKDKVEIKLQNKTTTRKKAKSPKTARKSVSASKQATEPEPSLELIPTVDENLLKMIENPDGSLELSEETLNQFAPVEDFHDPDLLFVLEDKSNQTLGK